MPALSAGEFSIGAATTDLVPLGLQLDPYADVGPGEALLVLLTLLGGEKARVPLVPERVEHALDGPVGLLLGVEGLLVYVVVADGVERLGVQRQALAVFFPSDAGFAIARDKTTRARSPPAQSRGTSTRAAVPRLSRLVFVSLHTERLY
jgi:hypothetical protein